MPPTMPHCATACAPCWRKASTRRCRSCSAFNERHATATRADRHVARGKSSWPNFKKSWARRLRAFATLRELILRLQIVRPRHQDGVVAAIDALLRLGIAKPKIAIAAL